MENGKCTDDERHYERNDLTSKWRVWLKLSMYVIGIYLNKLIFFCYIDIALSNREHDGHNLTLDLFSA